MAKIAVGHQGAAHRIDEPGQLNARVVASDTGWQVTDVVCSCGPHDPRFEEQHHHFVVAIVIAGTFQYRGSGRNAEQTMTPGSLLLGNAGQCFECGHEHGVGDRCLSFQFTAEYFAGAAGRDAGDAFRSLRLAPVRPLSPVIADASAALAGSRDVAWEELGIRLVARALDVDEEQSPQKANAPAAVARVTDSVRWIEEHYDSEVTLTSLAGSASLSPFHYLRTFERVTGTTPHQYMLRLRLRRAATRLATERATILDVAFDAGFGDLSNFNRAFRAEFGMSPSVYRQRGPR